MKAMKKLLLLTSICLSQFGFSTENRENVDSSRKRKFAEILTKEPCEKVNVDSCALASEAFAVDTYFVKKIFIRDDLLT